LFKAATVIGASCVLKNNPCAAKKPLQLPIVEHDAAMVHVVDRCNPYMPDVSLLQFLGYHAGSPRYGHIIIAI